MNALATLTDATRMLAEARTLDEVKAIKDTAVAAQAYARAKNLGDEAIGYATEIRLEASRRMGQVLQTAKETGEFGPGNPQLFRSGTIGLDDIGIGRKESSAAQILATVPDEEWPEVKQDAVTNGVHTERKLAEIIKRPHVANNSGNNEWYTPREFISAAREVMGDIDLDPASSAEANEVVCAARFFSADDDGLMQEWRGRVWMNPRKYGIICPCQKTHDAANANNSSLRHWSISHLAPQNRTDLHRGAESVQTQKDELASALENLLRDSPDAMLQLIAALESVPNANSLTLLQIFALVASLNLEPDLPLGAVNVSVSTLGLNRRQDALVLWNEIKSWLKSDAMPQPNEDANENASSLRRPTTSAAKDTLTSLGTGHQKTGSPVSDLGTIVAPTAGQRENSHRITSFPLQISNALEPFQETSFPPAKHVIVPSNTDPLMSGAPIPSLSGASSTTSSRCPNGCENVTIEYPVRVWLNPPYATGLIGQFADKLTQHFAAGDITEAICLVNNATETAWFNSLVNQANAVVFPDSRIRFWKANGETGAPLQGQAILHFGRQRDEFVNVFGRFGWVAWIFSEI